MSWKETKEKINQAKKRESMKSWVVRYKHINNNFSIPLEELREYALHDENIYVRRKAKEQLYILENYSYRKDYENVVSIKLVIPGGCNAKCEFCYLNSYDKMPVNKEMFLANFIPSLEEVLVAMDGKQPVSLDITGNEPTIDTELLKDVLAKIRSFRLGTKINRVVLTTNAYNLEKIIPYLKGAVDYVNISVHHYDSKIRQSIFRSRSIPTDVDYQRIIAKLLDIGIDATAVAVIYKEVANFSEFRDIFIAWCKSIGFQSIRFRWGTFWKDNETFIEYMNEAMSSNKFEVIQSESTPDSTWCRLVDDEGFFIFFLKGVLDTTAVSQGIEYVINDDGLCYTDFYKRTLLRDSKFPVGYIFDKK